MNAYLLFFIALIPIIWLLISLVVLKMPGHKTCPATLFITIILAIFVWKMPLVESITASLEGVAMAIWPIMLVIIAAVFTYNLSVYTKSMDVIKKMMTGITTDKRILVLILAWGFGGFLEAIAGFGTAVAIPASIMAALGFNPVFAAIICLIANTTPTAFGAIGLPVSTLAKITNIDVNMLSYAVGIQLALLIIIVPIILVMLTGKSVKAIKGVFFISLASGLSFAIPEIIAAKYLGAELPAILGSVICLIVTVGITKVFYKTSSLKKVDRVSLKEGFLAWIPFILIFIFIIFTSPLFKPISITLSNIQTSVQIYTGKGAKAYSFLWILNPGTLIIIATFIGGLIQGASVKEIVKVFINTIKQMSKSTITIISILALAKVMGYSGMVKSIAVVLVSGTGKFYPVIAPLIGALGTFVTGSDTSANVLFGGLQVEMAKSLGLNPYWLAAANTGGATAGKMISPQSIAVATAATGIAGKEGKILNSTLKFCVVYVIVLGIFAYFMGPVFGF
ncbi:L-lactate permease [Clostridium pasteurianum DSM 525 = ATCC 6013]|uniref:L-lactate permease n=1 Tax=Clostridium pasteurianum DSM 525 = ATCC 6013 TaxID=1262449 RepID=A0A0H3J3F5_CLOPA|nr:L-lactate permease [Clostridium pasteurianum]AJA48451.1 L-lactate permease [Clostridium pasteurianum DSM 525 = ATCC 6013]AJA52439.1 L-lactate permease [Clostridium pasteurianum DSM 525 = ATCC 6013]AOZ75693.1 lactate permease [Clostridium pasteurianum DSM 525 = ATCC 6013]AOZ79489.1 lactate permease [Clostridium pasteurianum]ELP60400.1 L-lactate permease [Clostridium pasteurianum DSM 525 = ATCC 6013]